MNCLEIIFIGVALATDAFALTVANCAQYGKTLSLKKSFSMPAAFALFQFIMPVIGYFIGSFFAGFLQSFAKFLTAGIFFVLSAKIIADAINDLRGKSDGETAKPERAFSLSLLLIQAIATSIDALAVGITFVVELSFSVFIAAGIIGAVTFIIVTLALFIGKSLGKLFGKYAVWLGAAILLSLAIKNLIEGLV